MLSSNSGGTLIPVKSEIAVDEGRESTGSANDDELTRNHSLSISSDSNDEVIETSSDSENNEEHRTIEQRRYPLSNRQQRMIEGAIPWNVVNL